MSKIRAKQRADFFGTSSEFNYKLNNSLARPPNTLAAEQSETLIKIFQEDNTYIGSPKTIHEPTQSKPNLIGFSELPARLLEKLKKREFHFNLMIIGYSGLGKSTFINSFFSSDIYNEDFKGPSERNEITKTTEVTKHSYYFEENDVKIRLTIIDTPGFGDHINNESCIDPIMEEINTRFSNYMAKELSINRNLKPNGASNYPSMYITEDERIHVCLYFVNPNTHGLSELDLNFLKKLHKKVPLIPIIAKADTLTIDECTKLKRKILYDIQTNELNIYNFSEKTQHSTEVKSEGCKSFSALRKKFPYAIVCSDKMITRADGKKVRGRNYPWGFVEVDNIDHNDFIALKSLLLKAHLEDLIDVTHQEHYDAYRRECLEEVCQVSNADDTGPLYHLEVEKREHKEKLKRLEAEMETIFQQKVNERTAKFRERELEFERQSAKILLRIEEELSKLEDDERLFLDQKTTWEANNREIMSAISEQLLETKEKSKTKKLGIF